MPPCASLISTLTVTLVTVRERRGVDGFDVEIGGDRLKVVSMPSVSSGALDMLTVTEREVALDVITGLSNDEIAQKRGRAPRTIANQLASLYQKLGIRSRAELTVLVLGES